MKKLSLLSALLFASSCFAEGLTGQWSIHNNIAGNESDQACKFVQADKVITGACKSDSGEVQITGSVDGKKVTWQYESDYNGTALTLVYTATLDDMKKISGAVEVQPYGVTGDFTAVPAKDDGK